MNELIEQICNKCFLIKSLEEFSLANIIYKGKSYRRKMCKVCEKIYKGSFEYRSRANAKRNNDEYRASRRLYKKLPHIKEKTREYDRKILKLNPLAKAKKNLRSRLRIALKVKSWKKTTKFYDYIGCSQDQLKIHIESLFIENMTWDNYGKWHIDHIIPLASAQTEEEMYKLCHYTNLQPLWAKDNHKKSNKIL